MISWMLQKIIGTQNERALKKLQPIVDKINSLEPDISKLSDSQLRAKTDEFKARIRERLSVYQPARLAGGNISESEEYKQAEKEILDEILPEAFAVVREAGKRTINMRHFDVQLMGGIVLHQGRIAEMATGEGKTLVATLAVYLNTLTERGVHIVTVNDYLAKRDREWMGPIYEFLGLSVGVIQHDMEPQERRLAYNCDVTYGTNNEFGFDYLRDNMVMRKEELVQRQYNFAIVDEVDSILIDEARTPLIISGPAEESTDKYYKIDKIIPRLAQGKRDEATKQETGDYIVDEKSQNAYLTEEGEKKTAGLLGLEQDALSRIEFMDYKHHIIQGLRAHKLFKKDVDYCIKDNEVIIVDEFTGRLMPGRRWSDGLHQAIEAKENVRIERENQTLATITFQNFFRMYKKLAGMTGTAATEAQEFLKIYNLDVVVIPTNRSLIRTNYPDPIYKTEKEKFNAVVDEIENLYKAKRPVLVGTVSIEKNELLSRLLKQRGIPHNVLNAKYHELEAHIVAQAGKFSTVTIATNMAGRGTDILLGGNPDFTTKDLILQMKAQGKEVGIEVQNKILNEFRQKAQEEHDGVVKLGGLHVIGTERHEARRIDNQLRGRSGRQGDPGSSRFYLSLEDDLMRIFGSERVSRIMDALGVEEGQVIEHPFITRAIETAQKRVESHNFEIRKHLLEYDNVMNKQREVIYSERRNVLESQDLKEHIFDMIDEIVTDTQDLYLNKNVNPAEWDWEGFFEFFRLKFLIMLDRQIIENLNSDEIQEEIIKKLKDAYEQKEKAIGILDMGELEKFILLQTIDSKWKDHLYNMDNLREGIGLRAYGERDPLVEYKREGFEMFSSMLDSIKEEALEMIFKVMPVREKVMRGIFSVIPQEFVHQEIEQFSQISQLKTEQQKMPQQITNAERPSQPFIRTQPKVGRNDPCPCGSGKKYKKCCGR